MPKIKTGKVHIAADEFKDDNVMAHISIRLPMTLLKELRKLSLTEEHQGKYQVLIRDVLVNWISSQRTSKKRRSK